MPDTQLVSADTNRDLAHLNPESATFVGQKWLECLAAPLPGIVARMLAIDEDDDPDPEASQALHSEFNEVCTNLDNAAVSVIEGSAMYITATEIVQLKRKFCEKTRWTEPAVYGDMGHAVDNPKKPHTAWFPPQKPAKFGVNKDVIIPQVKYTKQIPTGKKTHRGEEICHPVEIDKRNISVTLRLRHAEDALTILHYSDLRKWPEGAEDWDKEGIPSAGIHGPRLGSSWFASFMCKNSFGMNGDDEEWMEAMKASGHEEYAASFKKRLKFSDYCARLEHKGKDTTGKDYCHFNKYMRAGILGEPLLSIVLLRFGKAQKEKRDPSKIWTLLTTQNMLMCSAVMALLGYHTCYWERKLTRPKSVKETPCFADPPALYNAMVDCIEEMPDAFVKRLGRGSQVKTADGNVHIGGASQSTLGGGSNTKGGNSSLQNAGGAFVFTVRLLISAVDAKMKGDKPSINLAQRHRFLLVVVQALAVVAPEYAPLEYTEKDAKKRAAKQLEIVAAHLRTSFAETKRDEPWVMYLRFLLDLPSEVKAYQFDTAPTIEQLEHRRDEHVARCAIESKGARFSVTQNEKAKFKIDAANDRIAQKLVVIDGKKSKKKAASKSVAGARAAASQVPVHEAQKGTGARTLSSQQPQVAKHANRGAKAVVADETARKLADAAGAIGLGASASMHGATGSHAGHGVVHNVAATRGGAGKSAAAPASAQACTQAANQAATGTVHAPHASTTTVPPAAAVPGATPSPLAPVPMATSAPPPPPPLAAKKRGLHSAMAMLETAMLEQQRLLQQAQDSNAHGAKKQACSPPTQHEAATTPRINTATPLSSTTVAISYGNAGNSNAGTAAAAAAGATGPPVAKTQATAQNYQGAKQACMAKRGARLIAEHPARGAAVANQVNTSAHAVGRFAGKSMPHNAQANANVKAVHQASTTAAAAALAVQLPRAVADRNDAPVTTQTAASESVGASMHVADATVKAAMDHYESVKVRYEGHDDSPEAHQEIKAALKAISSAAGEASVLRGGGSILGTKRQKPTEAQPAQSAAAGARTVKPAGHVQDVASQYMRSQHAPKAPQKLPATNQTDTRPPTPPPLLQQQQQQQQQQRAVVQRSAHDAPGGTLHAPHLPIATPDGPSNAATPVATAAPVATAGPSTAPAAGTSAQVAAGPVATAAPVGAAVAGPSTVAAPVATIGCGNARGRVKRGREEESLESLWSAIYNSLAMKRTLEDHPEFAQDMEDNKQAMIEATQEREAKIAKRAALAAETKKARRAKLAAERAQKEAAEKAEQVAAAKAQREALEKAQKKAAEKAKKDAVEKAKQNAVEKAKQNAVEKSKQNAQKDSVEVIEID